MPFYRFELETTLRPDEAAERLQSVARESPGFLAMVPLGFVPKHAELAREDEMKRPFIGSVQGHSFRFYRAVHYRNSFLPQVSGKIAPISKGSKVVVTMFLHPIASLFMGACLLAAGIVAWKAFTGNQASDASLYGPIAGIVLGLALVASGFVPEAIKAKRLLLSILCDTPNEPLNRTRADNARAG